MSCTSSFFSSSRRRHTRYWRDWSSDVCSSDLRLDCLHHLVNKHEVMEAIQPGWLEAMLEHSQRREVGAVGPQILASDGTISSAGMTLGVFGAAGPAFGGGLPPDHPGYYDLARVIRNVSVLTGACVMMRRDTFEA